MASLNAGEVYTFEDVFSIAGFDLHAKAAVNYGDGVDHRRVKVGGLGFDYVEQTFRVPFEGADELEITVDGVVDTVLDVVASS